jgi:hypothetical protein
VCWSCPRTDQLTRPGGSIDSNATESSNASKSKPSILFAMHVSVTVCAGAINASYTISAMSAIKVGSVLGAGHLLQFLTPDSSASSRYSISISSNVSMCSDTKLMGTTTKFCTPLSPSSGRTSSVYFKNKS